MRSGFHNRILGAVPLRTLLGSTVFQLAVSLGAVRWLSRTFLLGRRVVVLHVAIVAALSALTVLGLGLCLKLQWVRRSPTARRLLSLVPAANFSALLLLYVMDYISNRCWDRNLNYEVVAQHFLQVATHGQGLVPIPGWLYGALGGCLLAITATQLSLSAHLWRDLEELFLPDGRDGLFSTRRRTAIAIAGVATLWLGIGGYLVKVWRTPEDFRLPRFEPVVSFFLSASRSIGDANDHALQEALRARQSIERAQYRVRQPFERKTVILIIVDCLRADHVQPYGYGRATTPTLSSWVASGRLRPVRMALSTCSDSNCGIQSTMSSQTYRYLSVENFKLYDVLRDQGYKLYFILSGDHTWYGLKEYYSEKPDLLFDGTNSIRYFANDDRLVFDGLERIPDSDGTPAFFSFHLMSVHGIGVKQERFRVYNPSDWDWTSTVTGRFDRDTLINSYDNGVVQADATINELFAALDRKGYLRNSIVFILADHGEGFGEHGSTWPYYGHTRFLYQEDIHIPMLIYDDPSVSYANLDFATQIDVAPTILDRLGLPIPASWQGRSLLDPHVKQYSWHQSNQKSPSYLVVERTAGALYKYMRASAGAEELYEIGSDPSERVNLIPTARPDLVQGLRSKLAEYLGERHLDGQPTPLEAVSADASPNVEPGAAEQ